MTERQLRNRILNLLKKEGWYIIPVSDRFFSGIPDLYILKQGRNVWLEIKAPSGIVSKIQQYTINQLVSHGGEAYVVRSVEEVKGVINV